MTVPLSLVGMIRHTFGTALGLTIYAVLFLLLANSPAVQQPTRDNSAAFPIGTGVSTLA